MTSLENILAFNKLLPYLDAEQRETISNAIGISFEEFEKRMIGITKEKEFILILLFFNVCHRISGFDEGISKIGEKTYTPDLILELNTGQKFLLEIKHTDKSEYSISGGNLEKRIEYASSLGLDLYFAISIHGFWMMFKSDYLREKHGKITIDDYKDSILDEVLDTYSYIFPPGIKIRAVYSKKTKKGMNITFEPYGELISYELYYNKKRIIRAKGKNSRYFVFVLLLQALQDRLSSEKQEVTECGEITVISDMDDGEHVNYISEYLFLLAPVMHTKDSTDEKKDASTVLNELKDDKSICKFPKEMYRGMIQELVNLGLPIMYIRNSLIYKLSSKVKSGSITELKKVY